ncbi:MAG: hypothetical protein KDA72_00040 [Planctomycetales bacterium]|nr:hypothetical protein [Planctomycetales bacterium]
MERNHNRRQAARPRRRGLSNVELVGVVLLTVLVCIAIIVMLRLDDTSSSLRAASAPMVDDEYRELAEIWEEYRTRLAPPDFPSLPPERVKDLDDRLSVVSNALTEYGDVFPEVVRLNYAAEMLQLILERGNSEEGSLDGDSLDTQVDLFQSEMKTARTFLAARRPDTNLPELSKLPDAAAVSGDRGGDARPEPIPADQRELDSEAPNPPPSEGVNEPAAIPATPETGGTVKEAVDAIHAAGGNVAYDDENHLIQVTLSGPFVTNDVMPYVAGRMHLEGVILENTKVNDEGVAYLAKLTNLQRLSIRGRNLTDIGMAHLKDLTRLGALAIECPDVTDAGLKHLAGMSELRSLSLDSTQVGDAGLAHIAKLSNLVELSLFNTRVSDAGLRRLEELRHLQRLNLQSTNVTDNGRARVERSRPPDFILAF